MRGSRNIFNDPDYLLKVEEGAWYGWPEYFDGQPATDARFKDPAHDQPQFLWKEHPPLTKAFTTFPSHGAINGLAFSPGGAFGFDGDIFVTAFGTFLPVTTGVSVDAAGFSVVRVSPSDGKVEDFATNMLPGPAYINQGGGFDRPSDVLFAPDGSLYVVDWGASNLGSEGLKLTPLTGAIWRIYPASGEVLRPEGAYLVEPGPQIPESEREAEVRNVPELFEALGPQIAIVIVVLVLIIAFLFFLFRRRKPSAKA